MQQGLQDSWPTKEELIIMNPRPRCKDDGIQGSSKTNPRLEYASAVWDPHQKYLQDKLEKVQNQAARFIASDYSEEPDSMTKILEQLKFEPVKQHRKQSRLLLFYKGLNHQEAIPTSLKDLQEPCIQSTL